MNGASQPEQATLGENTCGAMFPCCCCLLQVVGMVDFQSDLRLLPLGALDRISMGRASASGAPRCYRQIPLGLCFLAQNQNCCFSFPGLREPVVVTA